MAWGEKYVHEVETCIRRSTALADFDLILITDEHTRVDGFEAPRRQLIRATFNHHGLLRKTEMTRFLPDGYDAFLFLDSDTVVLEDIGLGFEKAERFLIAASPAPHYSLDHFFGFDRIMQAEGVPCRGQLQYNTGVIFFKNSPEVAAVFERWASLARTHSAVCRNDQPYFTLAMEQLHLNPYTLSISYNYRGFGDAISGLLRIWHSHGQLPERINEFDKPWPPRRAWPGRVVGPASYKGIRGTIRRVLRRAVGYLD
jgi:hypothetical protein